MKTRIAPTPSGYIHLGNALNFALTERWVQKKNGQLALRIDDFDRERVRDEYVQDIFDCLVWLKIKPSRGPQNIEDFKKFYSLQLKQSDYRDLAQDLYARGLAYACDCSRSTVDSQSEHGGYTGLCRDKKLKFIAGTHSLRLNCESNSQFWRKSLSDFVIWTKQDGAAYQLMSVVEDTTQNISFILRGSDLQDSSGAQIFLARQMGGDFALWAQSVEILHHPLVEDAQHPGIKLSKSVGALSLQEKIRQGYEYADFERDLDVFLKKLSFFS